MRYFEIFSLKNLHYFDLEGKRRTERWLPVVGYEGYYEISDLGRIKSLKRTAISGHPIKEKILKQRFNKDGYLVVTLRKDGPMTIPYVHKLVIIAFIENPLNKPECNHKWGIKTDNMVSELEWATKSENISHSFRVLGKKPTCPGKGKFGADHPNSRPVICTASGVEYDSISTASRKLNISKSSVWLLLSNKKQTIKGLSFQYK